jgi:hypothetical protein
MIDRGFGIAITESHPAYEDMIGGQMEECRYSAVPNAPGSLRTTFEANASGE